MKKRSIPIVFFLSLIILIILGTYASVPPPVGMSAKEVEHWELINAVQMGDASEVLYLIQKGSDLDIRDHQGSSPLIIAAKNGHLDIVTMLLENRADPNIRDMNGKSALLWACEKGYYSLVIRLLDNNADINVLDKNNAGVFMWAVYGGNLNIVTYLHENGADIHQKGVIWINKKEGSYFGNALTIAAGKPGRSMLEILKYLINECRLDVNDKEIDFKTGKEIEWIPFLSACVWGDYQRVAFLIEQDADVEKEFKGFSALHYAAGSGNKDIVNLLIEKGLDINSKTDNEMTVLTQAVYSGNKNVVKMLIDNGADVNLPADQGITSLLLASALGLSDIVTTLIEAGALINVPAENGFTPLMSASRKGFISIVQLLLKYGAEIDAVSNKGLSALMYGVKSGNLDVVKALLEYGAEVNIGKDNNGTALRYAIENGNQEMVTLLLEYNADLTLHLENGMTYLMLAIVKQKNEIIKLLIQHGAKTTGQNHKGWTGLMLATQIGNEAIVKTMLEANAAVNERNADNESSLLIALTHNHNNIARLLLRYGAEVNIQGLKGWTALHYLANTIKPDLDLCRLLIEKGALVNTQDNENRTPLHLVSSVSYKTNKTQKQFVTYLISQGADLTLTDVNGRKPLDNISEEGELGEYIIGLNSDLLHAARAGDIDEVQNYKNLGANLKIFSSEAHIKMDSALINGNLQLIEILLKAGLNPNIHITHTLYKTPVKRVFPLFFIAIEANQIEIVKLLLKYGADYTMKGDYFLKYNENEEMILERITPLELTKRRNLKAIRKLLIKTIIQTEAHN